ncbi:MAG: hypothetical protein AB7I42_08340 [Bradyrhizobium sp.]|uniref:hypothetical protein n=1 Tax=Bradyrhizobium sp. TaxID=376 RepID=UPI002A2BF4DD|nr:hypothetical protein [Bradyrhizobium sp.]
MPTAARLAGESIVATIVLGITFGGTASAQAPRQLHNKTVAFSFTSSSVQRSPDGKTRDVQTGINYLFYISSAGRIFERSSRSPGRGKSQTGQFGPDSSSVTRSGEAHNVHFEGNRLVSLRAFVNGASRMVVSFDQNYSSCTVSVQIAREDGGVIKRKGTDGIVREYLSIVTSDETCSIREGNPFAQ